MPTPGVVTIPKSTTSIPTEHKPSVTADSNICPLGRESLPIHTDSFFRRKASAVRHPVDCGLPVRFSFKNVPKAHPYSAAIAAVRFSPMMPLIPLMLIINFSAIPHLFNFRTMGIIQVVANQTVIFY
jgi:hypothetical protein